MYHDTSRQQQTVDWTKGQYGAYSIQGQVQQQKLEQMQRENAATKSFWDNHNKKTQEAWAPKPNTPTTYRSGYNSSGSGGGLAAFIVLLIVGFVLIAVLIGS